MEAKQKVMDWLANGKTGISSKSLAFEFLGVDYEDRDAPYDPADLNRCLKLIHAVPDVRKCVESLGAKHNRWKIMADNWGEIVACFLDEVGAGWPDQRKRATLTYGLMKDLGL